MICTKTNSLPFISSQQVLCVNMKRKWKIKINVTCTYIHDCKVHLYFYYQNINTQAAKHWMKKGISLVRKQHGNHLKTPGYHHVSPWFPLGKLEDSMWFPPKGNALRSGFRDSPAWKPGGNLGFPSWKPGGNYMEIPGFQRET